MQKPLTENRLKHIALFYLERFDASSSKIRQVLKRRISHQKMQGVVLDKDVYKWVENVICELTHLGYVDDKRYIENAIRRLSQSGKSSRYIRQKLLADGLGQNLIDQQLETADDLENARQFVHKKHLGKEPEKDLAKLARAGFDYEIAKEALKSGIS